jgi:hypothetical protein
MRRCGHLALGNGALGQQGDTSPDALTAADDKTQHSTVSTTTQTPPDMPDDYGHQWGFLVPAAA